MITLLAATPKKHALIFKSATIPMTLPPGGSYIAIACE
jgi:hypothetical protein